MREVDFLPDWYPRLHRRRLFLKYQGWLLLTIIVGAGGWLTIQQRCVAGAQTTLHAMRSQVAANQAEQQALDQQMVLRKQLQEREKTLASLGSPLETTRLLQTIEALMPKEMSLTDFNCTTEETTKAAAVSVARLGGSDEKQIEHRLKVRIVGVAPSLLDLANFLSALTSVPFLESVTPTYSSPRTDGGHLLREFEVTFTMNLDANAGASCQN